MLLILSNLHLDVLRGELTPELPRQFDIARGELYFLWKLDVVQPEGIYEYPVRDLNITDRYSAPIGSLLLS